MSIRSMRSLVVVGLLSGCTPAPAPNGNPPPPSASGSSTASASASADASPSATSSASAAASAPAVNADADVLVGTLVVAKGEKGRKSLENWLGRFKVVVGGESAREVRVYASSAVSEEALEKWAGKRVRVKGERIAPSAPDPMEQAPLGPDGKPMMRPGGLRVQSIESAP
jgi:3-oxoacyl-ACP reductase-like protein